MLTKGSAAPEDLTSLVGIIHLMLAAGGIRVWWEYVASDSNCSDGLSRYFDKDPVSAQFGWTPRQARTPPWKRCWVASCETLSNILREAGVLELVTRSLSERLL